MMKKFLLLGAAVLIAVSANAQAKRVIGVSKPMTVPKFGLVKPDPASYCKNVKATSANFGAVTNPATTNKAPKKANIIDLWYTRPAGAFPVGPVCVDGEYAGKYGITFYFFKPWKDYTYRGYVEGLDEGANPLYAWRYTIYDEEHDNYSNQKDLVVNYPMYTQDVMPVFFACFGNDFGDPNAEQFEYQSRYYTFNYNDNPPSLVEYEPNLAVALPSFNSFSDIEGYELYCYQHEFTPGGRFGDQPYTAYRYTGLKAFDPEEEAAEGGSGYWFGKNAGSIDGRTHVDGIAQAFEKPEHPYLLKRIGVELGYVNLVGPVEFTCKVYKLDALPDYDPEYPVALPAEPGELIATGKFTATPDMVDPNYNDLFLDFALMGHDEFDPTLEYEITPTVDYPILVVLDNYNDEGMENLKQFTTFCAYDWGRTSSENYGETAYLKIDRADEDGVFHNDYMWYGIHNFLGDYYTAYQISINIEQPFIDTYVTGDDEYTFPDEGGRMMRHFVIKDEEGEEELDMDGVYFKSDIISGDGDWFITNNDEEQMPDWLHLELEDLQVGDAYSIIAAHVSADPLPAGVSSREAKIRFEIPGDYVYYTFKQDETHAPNSHDVFAKEIKLDHASIHFEVGTTAKLVATVLPDSTTNKAVTWLSSNEDVATVNSTGLVTAVAVGNATITATTTDGTDLSASCQVTVYEDLSQYDNHIFMGDTTVFYGDTIVIPIAMTNLADITGVQTDIFLPEGLELVQVEDEYLIELSGRATQTHVVMSNDAYNGSIRLLSYSSKGKAFTGNEGDLFYITIKVADDAAGDYPIALRNTLLTTTDAVDLPAPDVTANVHVNAYLPGDANDSKSVTVSDIVTTAKYILDMNPHPFVFDAADVNTDGYITVSDIVLISRLILTDHLLNAPLRMPALDLTGDCLSAEDINLMPGEMRRVCIALDNAMEYTAFQLDLMLPAGLTASNFSLTDRASEHAFDVNTLSNGKTRVLCYSPNLKMINGSEGALLTFDVSAATEMTGDIAIDGIEFTTAMGQSVYLEAFTIGVNAVTGVNELTAVKSVTSVDYYNIAGQLLKQPTSGVNIKVTTYSDGTRTVTKTVNK